MSLGHPVLGTVNTGEMGAYGPGRMATKKGKVWTLPRSGVDSLVH